MNIKSLINGTLVGLTLVAGTFGATHSIPGAHARAGGPIVIIPGPLKLLPYISTQSWNCGLTVTGKFFTPNTAVNISMWNSDGSTYRLFHTTSTTTGTISVDMGDDHIGPEIYVRAVDLTAHTSSNGVNELAFCIK